MELTLITIISSILGSIICGFIDSHFGMMYGTILSPVLLIAGFDPMIVIPSIIFSEICGSAVSTWRHNHFGNIILHKKSKDFLIPVLIAGLGILAVILGVFIAISIPKLWLKTYIGILCIVMGGVILLQKKFKFSWKKMMGLGILSAFNKAISGGGFGPIVVSGQLILGRKGKKAIGTTEFAEMLICLVAFTVWILTKGLLTFDLLLLLTFGSLIGNYFGPLSLSKFESEKKLKMILGILVIVLGIWTLVNTWLM